MSRRLRRPRVPVAAMAPTDRDLVRWHEDFAAWTPALDTLHMALCTALTAASNDLEEAVKAGDPVRVAQLVRDVIAARRVADPLIRRERARERSGNATAERSSGRGEQ